MLDIPLLVGQHGDWYRWWGGPKVLVGSYKAGATLNVPAADQTYGFHLSGTSSYVGAQVGGALGYKWIFIATELTVVRFSTTAKFTAEGTGSEPYESKLSGAIVYPGVALLGEF
jgi:hypothetical protein